jgi:hydrogenase maturation protease
VTGDVLVVGYGNALRSDDGFGWHAAARLADDPRIAGTTVLQRHQLTPDLALDLSRASFAIFVDASTGPAGVVAVRQVRAAPDSTVTWSHHVDPSVLLALARDLYGRAPEGLAVSVGLGTTEPGERLSSPLARILPNVVDDIVRWVRAWRGAGPVAVGHGGSTPWRTGGSPADDRA